MFEKNYRLQDIQLSKIGLRPCGRRRDRAATDVARPVNSMSAAAAPTLALLRGLRRAWPAQPKPAQRKLRRAKAGGEYRARTGDLLVANQALSQLS